jgi:hypothetical protein
MARLPSTPIRQFSISEIAELWSHEVEEPPRSAIERELRLYVVNAPRLRDGLQLIDPIPDDANLPPSTTRLTRDQVAEFCDKQRWPKPRFWFGDESQGASFAGRPSYMRAIVQELHDRAQAGALNETLAGQSRDLKAWVDQQYPRVQTPTARTIENGIRNEYRRLMGPRN